MGSIKNKKIKVEIDRFSDGRLKLIVYFTPSSNFWVLENGTYSYVPTKEEIQLIKESLDAIDTYNLEKKGTEDD